MLVVMLDIDGVLVTQRSMQEAFELGKTGGSSRLREGFDSNAVSVFNAFIKRTKAKVVISSAWRMGQTVASMQEMLDRNGIKCTIIGLTPQDPEDQRGLEIKAWLRSYTEKTKEYPDYLVIDDEIGDIVKHIPPDKVIHVDHGLMNNGLTEEHLKGF